ncbi:MAG: hypothetical protein ACM3UP_00180, partial [Methanocella sp.]
MSSELNLSPYNRVDEAVLEALTSIVGPENVLLSDEDCEPYSHDEMPGVPFPPEVVVRPADAAQISA